MLPEKIIKNFVKSKLNPSMRGDLKNFFTVYKIENEKYMRTVQYSVDRFSLKSKSFADLVFKTDGSVFSFPSKKVKENFIGKFNKKREVFILSPSFLILVSGANGFYYPPRRFFDIYLSKNIYKKVKPWFNELRANYNNVG